MHTEHLPTQVSNHETQGHEPTQGDGRFPLPTVGPEDWAVCASIYFVFSDGMKLSGLSNCSYLALYGK